MKPETKRQLEQVQATIQSSGWKIISAELKAKIEYLDENWYIVSPEEREKLAIERVSLQKFFDTIDGLLHPVDNE